MVSPKPKAPAWNALKHAYGPATRVPEQVKGLLGERAFERDENYWLLTDTLVGVGEWFEASAPAVAALLDAFVDAPEPHRFLLLVANMLGANHERAWQIGPQACVTSQAAPARAAALARQDLIGEAMGAARPATRAAAAVLLTLLTPELGSVASARIKLQATDDPVPMVRANALLSLACIGHDWPAAILPEARRSDSKLVRGAAEVAALRLDDARPLDAQTDALVDWLSLKAPGAQTFEPDDLQLAWFARYLPTPLYRGLPGPDQPIKAVLALLARRGEAEAGRAIDLLVALASANPGYVELHAAKALLALGGFSNRASASDDRVLLKEELTDGQRAMAARLARSSLLPVASFGLPASGLCRARWIGLEPPGPLDRVVEVPIGKRIEVLPLWRALCKLTGARGEPFPPVIDDLLQGLDRFEGLVEHLSYSYMESGRMPPGAIERELSLTHDPAFFERAARVGDDLAKRLAAAQRCGIATQQKLPVSSLLLLPFVRALRPIDDLWDPLVFVGKDPLALEVLSFLSAERRERILLAYLRHAEPHEGLVRAGHVVEIVGLAPTRRIAQAIIEKASEAGQSGSEAHAMVLKLLNEAAETHPELRAT